MSTLHSESERAVGPVVIARRFRDLPESANGGYTAGVLAARASLARHDTSA